MDLLADPPASSAVVSCCPDGLRSPLDRGDATTLAGLFKALADPARLQLLAALSANEAGEACVCDLTGVVGLSQPTVSHHLKVLTQAGLLRRERRGTWAWYSVDRDRLAEVAAVLR